MKINFLIFFIPLLSYAMRNPFLPRKHKESSALNIKLKAILNSDKESSVIVEVLSGDIKELKKLDVVDENWKLSQINATSIEITNLKNKKVETVEI